MFDIKGNIPELADAYYMQDLYHTRTEDTFIKKFGHTIDNIKIVSDAIPQDTIDSFLKILKSYPVLSDRDHCYAQGQIPGFQDTPESFRLSEETSKNLIKIAEEAYGEELIVDKPFLLMTHPTGSYIDPHTDILDIDYEDNDPVRSEGPDKDEQVVAFENMWSGHLSILAYLNEDYEGGYLYFPEFDYYLKPKAGDVVMFPGSLYYVHGVSKVTSGVRYALSQWAKFKFYAEERSR